MSYSLTGLAYLFGFAALSLLAYRFLQHFLQERNPVSKFFFLFTAFLSLFMLCTALGGLFFAKNTLALKIVVVLAAFIQSFIFADLAYLLSFLKFPKASPWWAAGTVFLIGFLATILSATIPFAPYLDSTGSIFWNIPAEISLIRTFLFLITFLPLIFVLAQQFSRSEDKIAKTRALGIILALGFGVITAFSDFILNGVLDLGAISSDIAMITLSVILFIVGIFTQKARS
jgi:hypothetical protein